MMATPAAAAGARALLLTVASTPTMTVVYLSGQRERSPLQPMAAVIASGSCRVSRDAAAAAAAAGHACVLQALARNGCSTDRWMQARSQACVPI